MKYTVTFTITKNTVLENLSTDDLDIIYELLNNSNDSFKLFGVSSNLSLDWMSMDNFYTVNDITFNSEGDCVITCEINIEENDDIKNYFEWAIYGQQNAENKNKVILLCRSKNIYLLTSSIETVTECDRTSGDVEIQEAISRLDYKASNVFIPGEGEVIADTHEAIEINDKREIIVSNDNIVINRDNNSQEITFKIPRYYDSIDLTKKELYIYYIAPDSEPLKEKIQIDLIEEKEFRATWIFKLPATAQSGIMTFAIIAEGSELEDDYFWQTFPATFKIHQGIFSEEYSTEEDFFTTTENSKYKELLYTVSKLESAYLQGELLWQKLPEVANASDL